jgi:hypothetical protein
VSFVNNAKLEMTNLIIRKGRTSEVVPVPSGGDPYEIYYAISQNAPTGDREPRPEEVLYALLVRGVNQEARDHIQMSRTKK